MGSHKRNYELVEIKTDYDKRVKEELTEKEEHYCQLRSQGQTKSGAARIAYTTNNPGHMGWEVELKPLVQERILQLKEERAEAYGLDPQEQIRRYNQLYQMALEKGQLSVAAKMLERLDILGGFESPTKSISMKVGGDALKDPNGNLKKDLSKFSELLKTHSENSVDKSKVTH